jgi:hypothetical protein
VGAQVSAAKWRRRREGLGDSTVRWRGGPAGGNSRKLVASGRAGDQHTWGGGSGTSVGRVDGHGPQGVWYGRGPRSAVVVQLLWAGPKGNSIVFHLFKNFAN